MRYVAHVPLIGGFALANQNITKTLPVAVTSYSPFEGNDNLYLRYLQKKNIHVPYFQIDKLEEGKIRDVQHLIGKLDFASAVPPCSGLSLAGNIKKGCRGTSPVNDWMYKSAEFMLGTLRPTVYVFENAPTLFTSAGDVVREQLIEIARYHGYAGTFYKTDTLLHGIPQRRPRTYAIFHKGNQAPILEYHKEKSPTISEYLKSIPKDATLQNKYATKEPFINDFEIVKYLKQRYNNQWREELLSIRDHISSYGYLHKKDLLEDYQKFVDELKDQAHPTSIKDIAHVIKKINMGKNFRLSHRVLILDKDFIYAVVGEMMERNLHPTEDRRINIREYLHLMGMPHDFDLEDNEFGKLPQNCPVKTNEFITKEVIAIIKGKRQFSSQRFEMQNNIKYEGIKTKQLF